MIVQEIETNRVIPYAQNPRKNEAGVKKVANSIREFGWQQPIVVDTSLTIIAGHTRFLAAKSLNLKTVPIVIADKLSEAQIIAYRIADNRTAEESSWDEDLLLQEIEKLHEFNFDVIFTGLNEDELKNLMDENTTVNEKEFSQKYEIVVECSSEQDQENVFKLMTSKGYTCRVLSM